MGGLTSRLLGDCDATTTKMCPPWTMINRTLRDSIIEEGFSQWKFKEGSQMSQMGFFARWEALLDVRTQRSRGQKSKLRLTIVRSVPGVPGRGRGSVGGGDRGGVSQV